MNYKTSTALRRLAHAPGVASLSEGFLSEPVIAAFPSAHFTIPPHSTNPFRQVSQLKPPPGGIIVGALSYELGPELENVTSRYSHFPLPSITVYVYEAAYFPKTERITGTSSAATYLRRAIRQPASNEQSELPFSVGKPHYDFNRSSYIRRVHTILDHIRAGDIYQANFSRGLTVASQGSPLALFERFEKKHPARFGAYLDLGEVKLVSNSPELLLRVKGDKLLTQPIKGTRPRSAHKLKDQALSLELSLSEKESAEHAMIVDVSRNDLGRIAETGSVRVKRFKYSDPLPTVFHSVSDVIATLKPGLSTWNALEALYPAASITGAPKIRAMEIIHDLEKEPRGIYCGSIFAITEKQAAFSVAIRTAQFDTPKRNDRLALHWRAGGGIVFDSKPESEWDEIGWKSKAFLHAIGLSL